MNDITVEFLGNPWLTWASAILTAITAHIALRLIRNQLVRRISAFAEKTSTQLDDLALDLIRTTRTFFIIAVSVYAGSFLLKLSERSSRNLNRALILVALLQAAIWGSAAIRFWLDRYVKRRAAEDLALATTVGLVSFLARMFLYVTILLLAMSNLGIDITALVAGLGVGGIAVALAAQNILGDLFASLTIVLDKPFIVGDFIVVGEFMGTIEHIGLKTTRLRSLSGEQLIFANADLLQSRIRNFKRMQERRAVFLLQLSRETPVEKLKRVPLVLRELVEAHPQARFERSHFKDFGSHFLNFETVYWINNPDYLVYADIQQEINLGIHRRFAEEGIGFAQPVHTVAFQGKAPA